MNLHLTAISERGKPVTKSGNDYIDITINDENREAVGRIFLQITFDNLPIIALWSKTKVFDFQEKTSLEALVNNYMHKPKPAIGCDCPSVDCPKHPVEFKEQAEI